MANKSSVIDRVRRGLEETHAAKVQTLLVGVAILELAGAILDAATLAPRMRDPIVAFDLALVVGCIALRAGWRRAGLRVWGRTQRGSPSALPWRRTSSPRCGSRHGPFT
jgi:hypothetical protein